MIFKIIKSGILHIIVFLASILCISGCNPNSSSSQTQTVTSQNSSKTTKTTDSASTLAKPTSTSTNATSNASTLSTQLSSGRKATVSRFELDDLPFKVTKIALGLQNFVSQNVPILTFSIPLNADYIEIMRCSNSANIVAPSGTTLISDIGMSANSQGTGGWASNDFFRAAEQSSGCETISLGTVAPTYLDSYAPSDTFRYILRSCVAKERMVDTQALTDRNCSKQLAVSNAITYQNKRKDLEQLALKKEQISESNINATLWQMRILAEKMIQAGQICEDREADRAIATKKKEAWVTIVSTAADVAMELCSYGRTDPSKILVHYTTPTSLGRVGDQFGMLASLGGMSTRQIFLDLTTNSEDTPRTCANLLALQDQMQAYLTILNKDFYGVAYYTQSATVAAQGIDILDSNAYPAPSNGFTPDFKN